MATEIERKYLLRSDAWRNAPRPDGEPRDGTRMLQGYISDAPGRTVRVRIAGEEAWLTIKGAPSHRAGPLARLEFEYSIPIADATTMLDALCSRPFIDKTRHRRLHADHLWEIDVFAGENRGLIVAEVELSAPDEAVPLPVWIGAEVTDDHRYSNSSLVSKPYCTWSNR